jgi:hypothetical protein
MLLEAPCFQVSDMSSQCIDALTHANGTPSEENHAASQIDHLGPEDRHDLAEKTYETSTWDEEGTVQECELFSFLD